MSKQTLLDLTLQTIGSIEGLISLMNANNKSDVTATVDVGTVLLYNDEIVVDAKVAGTIQLAPPATGVTVITGTYDGDYYYEDYDSNDYYV
jgi:hypothetical protein